VQKAILFAALALAATSAPIIHAQTPPPLPWQSTIQQLAPPNLAPCLVAINARENPYGDLHEPNHAGSSAQGLFQMMPSTWRSTPTGQTVDLAVASAAEQVAAATELLMSQGAQPWSPAPPDC
jgi:hypothetical protein